MYYVYQFQNKYGEELYFGFTNNLDRRMYEHFCRRDTLTAEQLDEVTSVGYIDMENAADARMFEIYCINKFGSKYNKMDATNYTPSENPMFEDYCNIEWQEYEIDVDELRHKFNEKARQNYAVICEEHCSVGRFAEENDYSITDVRKVIKWIPDFIELYIYRKAGRRFISLEGQKVLREFFTELGE